MCAMDEHAPIVYDLTKYKEETKDWDKDPSAYLLRYYTKSYFLSGDGKCPTSKIIDQETGLEIFFGDQFVYQSPNKLCIIGLAPSHPLIAQSDRYKVLNLRFDPKILSSLPQPTAIPANSKKQSPPSCHCDTVICKIEALDLWANKEADKSASSTCESDENQISLDITVEEDIEMEKPTSIGKEDTRDEKKKTESVDPSRVIFAIRGSINGHVFELNEKLLRRDTPIITDPVVTQTVVEKASTHGFIAVIRPKSDKAEVGLANLCTAEDYKVRLQKESSSE